MKLKRLKIAVIGLVAVVLTAAAGGVAYAKAQVPFKASSVVAVTSSFGVPDADGNLVVSNTYAGAGNATQLGKFTISGTQVFKTPLPAAFSGLPVDGSFVNTSTWTAANGDELIVEETGILEVTFIPALRILVPTLVNREAGQGTWTVVGGTGRFQNATGSGTLATGVLADFSVPIENVGVISSLGSTGGNGKKK